MAASLTQPVSIGCHCSPIFDFLTYACSSVARVRPNREFQEPASPLRVIWLSESTTVILPAPKGGGAGRGVAALATIPESSVSILSLTFPRQFLHRFVGP